MPTSRAFTLMECLFATTVLAVAALAVAQAVSSGQAQTQAALGGERAQMLAQTLMEEVLALPYADPGGGAVAGPDAGESSRALFDNADDFHNFSEAAGALRDHAAVLYPTIFQTYSRQVTAVYGSVTVTGFSAAVPGLTVTVTVTDARGQQWSVVRFVPQPL
ncbi:MAG: prepilin-type N-terminal cleavage/methylation domain-containing protein [Phycisphaeraceae bacterium]